MLLDCNLVFYVLVNKKNAQDRQSLLYFRDFRQDLELSRVRYFVLSQNRLQESVQCLDRVVDEKNYFFVKPDTFCKEPNLLKGLSRVCGYSDLSQQLTAPRRLDYLEAMSARIRQIWADKTVLLVSFKGARGKFPTARTTAAKLFVLPKRCIFEVRCVIAGLEQKTSMENLNLNIFDKVICVFGNSDCWCELRPAYEASILEQCNLKPNCDVLRDRVETLEVGAGGTNLFGQSAQEEAASKAAKRKLTGCDLIRRYCRCTSCAKDKAYNDNMRLSGPEKLLTRTLSPSELLTALGLDEHRGVLEELSRLSVAAFDIESMTVPLDHERPGVNLPQADIDFANLAQHNVALQKPIMLAHRDGLMSPDVECPVFTLTDNRESSIYQLMRDYWKFVRSRQQESSAAKRILARPLLDVLEQYHLSYLNYAKDWVNPNSGVQLEATEVTSGWKFSLPGRLQRHLYQLTEKYEIFSFYGAGYDQVLLTGYLVPYLFEKKMGPRVEKNGNKVTVIKVTKCGVTFRDVVRLLSPGTSLKQFGQLFNLEQAKAHFPFGLLTGVEALDIAELPLDPLLWRSDLSTSKEAVSETDIAEAVGLFRQAGCQNLGDYLRTYLRLDVDILYKATQGWRKNIAEEIGVDFVQAGKFTISSLSSFAGDLNASQNLHVGQFFPNSAAVYRLLRKGMRG